MIVETAILVVSEFEQQARRLHTALADIRLP
jgi:hypothetical protein